LHKAKRLWERVCQFILKNPHLQDAPLDYAIAVWLMNLNILPDSVATYHRAIAFHASLTGYHHQLLRSPVIHHTIQSLYNKQTTPHLPWQASPLSAPQMENLLNSSADVSLKVFWNTSYVTSDRPKDLLSPLVVRSNAQGYVQLVCTWNKTARKGRKSRPLLFTLPPGLMSQYYLRLGDPNVPRRLFSFKTTQEAVRLLRLYVPQQSQPIHVYSARNAAVVRLGQNLPMPIASRMCGHKSIDTTRGYCRGSITLESTQHAHWQMAGL